MAKKSLKKIPLLKDDKAVDHWLQKADLTEYFSGHEFQKTRFARLEKKLVDDAYSNELKSQPVTLRLPQTLIMKLKLLAMKKGLAYQTMARLILQKSVNHLL